MIEILIWAFILWAIFQIFQFVMSVFIVRDLKEKIRETIAEIVHEVSIEKINDVEYWYDQDSGQFLGQGRTMDEIISVLKQRFPDHIFLVNKKVLSGPNWQVRDSLDTIARQQYYFNKNE